MASGILEAVWAIALGASAGLSRPAPTALFLVALALSMTGLAFAMRNIGMATAYAVWVGIGAALTVGWSMATGAESASFLRVALLAGIVGCVIGLKLVDGAARVAPSSQVSAGSAGAGESSATRDGPPPGSA